MELVIVCDSESEIEEEVNITEFSSGDEEELRYIAPSK